jgi:AcrR family transcriptional regulator
MAQAADALRGERPDHLAERLVQVTLELLAEDGIEGITLRRIARRAGVSHGAPARHFRSHADLLAEVAARGFGLLSETMQRFDRELPASASARERLTAAGRGYVDAGVANPALFTLMFRTSDLDLSNAAFVRESRAAFEALLGYVEAAQATGWHAEHDTRLVAGSIWAAFHGLATLWAQGAFRGPIPDASLEDALRTTLMLVDDPQGDNR